MKLICHDCGRVIPAQHFEKDNDADVEGGVCVYTDVKLSDKGNGYCKRCISEACSGEEFDDCI